MSLQSLFRQGSRASQVLLRSNGAGIAAAEALGTPAPGSAAGARFLRPFGCAHVPNCLTSMLTRCHGMAVAAPLCAVQRHGAPWDSCNQLHASAALHSIASAFKRLGIARGCVHTPHAGGAGVVRKQSACCLFHFCPACRCSGARHGVWQQNQSGQPNRGVRRR